MQQQACQHRSLVAQGMGMREMLHLPEDKDRKRSPAPTLHQCRRHHCISWAQAAKARQPLLEFPSIDRTGLTLTNHSPVLASHDKMMATSVILS